MLADVVEPGKGTVRLPGDDDRLTVALVEQPVALIGDLVGAPGDQPRVAQNLRAFLFETLGIAIDVGREGCALDGRALSDTRAESQWSVASRRLIDHRCLLCLLETD